MRSLFITSCLFVCLSLISCGGSGSISSIAESIPDSDYNLIVSVKPAEIWESELMKDMLDELPGDVEDAFDDWLKEAVPVGIEDIKSVAVAIEMGRGMRPATDQMLVLAHGAFDENDLEDLFETITNGRDHDTDKEDAGNFEMTVISTGSSPQPAYAMAGDTAVLGPEKSVEDCLELKSGDGDALSGTKEFMEAASLVDGNAHISVLAFDMQDIIGAVDAKAMAASNEMGLEEEFFESLEEMTAAGVSIRMDSNLSVNIRILLDGGEDAEDFHAGVEEAIDFVNTNRVRKEILRNSGDELDEDELEDFLDSISSQRNRNTVEIKLIVPHSIARKLAILPPSLLNAIESSRQKTTLANMQTLAMAITVYSINFPRIGVPDTDIDGLKHILMQELDEVQSEAIFEDAWGWPLVYEKIGGIGSKRFRITSYGSDGSFGPKPRESGVVRHFEEDLIYENDGFVQGPQGLPRYR